MHVSKPRRARRKRRTFPPSRMMKFPSTKLLVILPIVSALEAASALFRFKVSFTKIFNFSPLLVQIDFIHWISFFMQMDMKKMQEVNRKYCLNPLQKLCSNKFRSAMNGSILWIGTENLIIDAKIKLWLEFSSSHDSFFNEISPLNYYQKCFCQYLYNFVIQKVINIE